MYNYTRPLSLENEPYTLETIPLIREHLDSCLFYIRHRSTIAIRVHRQALFAQSATWCFQYLEFHDHTFNRAKLANYVICPGFHGFSRRFQ